MLLASEDVLDGRVRRRSPRVGSGDALGQGPGLRLGWWTLLVNMPLARRASLFLEQYALSAHTREADRDRQPCAIVRIGGAGIPSADQATCAVDVDMVL